MIKKHIIKKSSPEEKKDAKTDDEPKKSPKVLRVVRKTAVSPLKMEHLNATKSGAPKADEKKERKVELPRKKTVLSGFKKEDGLKKPIKMVKADTKEALTAHTRSHLNVTKPEEKISKDVKEKTKAAPAKKAVETEEPKHKAKPAKKDVEVTKEKSKLGHTKKDAEVDKENAAPLKKAEKEKHKSVIPTKEIVVTKEKSKSMPSKMEVEAVHINATLTKERMKAMRLKKEQPKRAIPPPARKITGDEKPKKKTVSLPIMKEERHLKEKQETVRKEKSVEKKPAKEEKATEQPPVQDDFLPEDELPYFQCFFVDEDEAQFPFYAFSPLQM